MSVDMNLTRLMIEMFLLLIGNNFNSNSGKTTVGARMLHRNADPSSSPTHHRAMGKRR